MPDVHDARPRGRSPFVAAFLSLVFPGLGHAYLGAHRRALGFAAPPILLGALAAGIAVRLNLFELAGLAAQSWFLTGVFVINLVALAYRAAAIADAWRIARWLDRGSGSFRARSAGGPAGPSNLPAVASIVGLVAVLGVMSLAHIAVARYDLVVARAADCIFDAGRTDCQPTATASPDQSADATDDVPTDTPEPTAVGTPVPAQSIPPWNGTDRLNILLIGADEQGGGHNTDTMITVSIDPTTDQVVMFQLPRDTVDVPVPSGPAQKLWGSVYQGKINSWFVNNRKRADLWPGTDQTRGYNALKSIIGNLYGIDIQYFVEVNFDGFQEIVDALGGVTVNVQVPVVDDRYPAGNSALARVYIPAGMQHMTGAQALVYARSRHASSDFDRAARQQRILLALRQETDIASVLPRIDELASAVSASLRTDIPRELVPQLLGLASKVDVADVRSYIFTPPYYQVETLNDPTRGYIIQPRIDRIRAAIRDAFTVDPQIADQREVLEGEGATVYVLNGSGNAGEATHLASYLEYLGINASAPAQKPDVSGLKATTLRVYNGAEADMPQTVATLERLFGVTADLVSDPTVVPNVVVITGSGTPALTPPPLP